MPIPQFQRGKTWKARRIKTTKNFNQASKTTPSWSPTKYQKKPKNFGSFIKFSAPYILMAISVVALAGISIFAWYSRDLPRPDKIIDRSIAQSTKIYDRTGEHLLFEAFDTHRRTIIPLDQIPNYVKWGTILIEDKKFYEHSGFDLKGIARAIIKDILSLSKSQGASTLTQQLVKNALLSSEKEWSRKIKELVLSYQIERKFSKDQILQMYLNEIPYGSNTYGIESASQFYFEKSAKDLTLAEAATIAALPQAPTYYSPYGSHKDMLMARKDYIIDLLIQEKIITQSQADQAKNEELKFSEKTNSINAPHFVIWVREQLAKKYGEQEVEQGGLKVITTLDWATQKAAEEAIEKYCQTNSEKYNAQNAALVAINPKTGEILAMVGSRDYFNEEIDGNYNVAVQGKRQPGSSFKPFVYALGFEKGYTDKTTLWDVKTNFGDSGDGKEYSPSNYDSKEHGPVSIRTALQWSLNIPAVKMLYLVGPKNVIKKARQFGYTTFSDPDRYGLSLVLGGAEVKLIEHTNAYAMLANKGIKHDYASILKVEDSKNKTLEEFKPDEGERVMEEKIALLLSNILSDNQARSDVFGERNYLNLGDRPVAAKTGTTNDYKDAWTLGYTPSLAAGVWVGNNDSSAMKRGAGGSTVAAPIWNDFMKKALTKYQIEYFEDPQIEYPKKPVLRGDLEGGTPVKIDRASGLLATEMTPPSFIEEKIFRIGHNILHYVKPNDPTGDEPSPSERDWMYSKWEEPVLKWMSANNWKTEEGGMPTEYDNMHVIENRPSISIIEPKEGQSMTGEIIYFKVDAWAPRGISRIEFYVNDELVSQARNAPYVGRYISNQSEPSGTKTLKAIAYDDIDNSETVYVDFNLISEKISMPTIWASPAEGSIFNETKFPIQIKLKIPNGISKADIYAVPKNDSGQYKLINSIQYPQQTIETYWSDVPNISGEWEIYAVLWQGDAQNRTDSVKIILDVPE